MFLILMVAGLVGLAMMALPAVGRHGNVARGALHAGHAAKLGPMTAATAALRGVAAKSGTHVGQALVQQGNALAGAETESGIARFIPSPRLICSLLALYGAFGNALLHAAHFSPLAAGLLATVPAILLEKFAVTPLWRLLFRFQGQPSSPLEELVLSEAKAVTPFRNGRGLVSLVRDGRLVQFAATLIESQAALSVRVGDRLQVEEVDGPRERVTVSVPPEDQA
ncbi:MAG TPA: hypothetical protein VII38_16330 [Polyangia bacterium]|jgi:hypothetical protein